MRAIRLCIILVFICGAAVIAAPQFPDLTGRVVDDAHVLSAPTVQSLTGILEDYENGTGNQVVVVTLPSLNGYDIADYGYQLGRHWQIGQKDKNNGALLIVAPAERKVRIEVGYGLEGQLTDAQSSTIIQGIILPAFRSGQMEQGIVDGTQAMVDVLGGKSLHVHYPPHPAQHGSGSIIIYLLIAFFWLRFAIKHPLLASTVLWASSRENSGNGSSGGGGSGGGFSGGGGSFGGGGSSGSW